MKVKLLILIIMVKIKTTKDVTRRPKPMSPKAGIKKGRYSY